MKPILLAFLLVWVICQSAFASDRPNVLMIVVDDMNDWVGCLGGYPQVRTPNIDRLANRGLLFTNAHVAAPVCNPSRVATLTGLRPSTTGIYGNDAKWLEAMPDVPSIPQHFKANGYHVVGGGKVNHHMPGFNRHSDWHDYFDQIFDSHYQDQLARGLNVKNFAWPSGFPLNRLEAVKTFSKPPQNANEFDWGAWDMAGREMGDGRMVEWAAKFLAQPTKEPFFLAAGIYRPHLPFYAPRKYFDMYPQDQITLPPIKADDCDDLPAAGKAMAADRRGDYELVMKEGRHRELVQAYLASITFADALIGQLLDALDASPAANNTIVVLWSDHGWHLGEKQHLHKFTLWERSTRVPCIIAAPGTSQKNTRTARPVGLIDLFPTLNELCDLPPVEKLDGVSLVPLIKDPSITWDKPALTTHGQGNHAVRSERWRYIRYADGGEELYDHDHDPNEWNNLADKTEFAPVKAELAGSLPQTDVPSLRKTKKKKSRTSSQDEPAAARSRAAVSPYPMSSVIGGFTIDPERKSIGHGDSWAITWAADDRQYSFHTDGRGFGLKESVSTAPVVIEGSPRDIRGRDIATTSGSIPKPDGAKSSKVSGVAVIQNVLYAWGKPETRFAPHIPQKWISDDGTSFYLLYSCIPKGPYQFNIQRCHVE